MTPIKRSYDVVVVGAGPAGCATAIAHARRGADVLVLEADPRASKRFAGEWLHPTGVGVLDDLRIGRLEKARARSGYGFVIFPDDGSEPIEMPYGEGVSLSGEHCDLVDAMREATRSTGGIELATDARAVRIAEGLVRVEDRETASAVDVRTGRIVGADGRNSVVRKSLGDDSKSAPLSYMAAVELRDVELPREGFGHLILGGPGPALLYRISDGVVRGCLDVPIHLGPRARSLEFLWDGFSQVMPPSLLPALRAALERGPSGWAINRFRPRTTFGRGGIATVGDAVGHVHPMTAMGMTLGLLDAKALAATDSVEEYAKTRRSYVPELLSNALYHCFRREDPSATAIREAMFRTLRSNPRERERTMNILAGADPSRRSFGSAFLRIAAQAVGGTLREPSPLTRLAGFGEWLQWPAALAVPPSLDPRVRAKSSTTHPIPQLETIVPTAAPVKPPSPPARSEASEASLSEAMERGSATLLRELESLAMRFGEVPDAVLAGPALSCMRAVVGTPMRAGMAARMTLGRRRLATEGFSRLLSGKPECRHLAELALVLLDGATWEELPMASLAEGTRALLDCQSKSGGFARSRDIAAADGAAGELELTMLACRAIEVIERRRPGATDANLARVLERSATWVRELQLASGSWGEDLSRTAWALEAMRAAGVHAGDPSVRRGVRWLVDALENGAESATQDVQATARAVRALAQLGGAPDDVVVGAARRLAERPLDSWQEARLTVEALTACEARRAGRPRRSQPPASGAKAKEESAKEEATMSATTTPATTTPATTTSRTTTPAMTKAPVRTTTATHSKASPDAHTSPIDAALREDWDYCKTALGEVSRTFARPIALLPDRLEVAVSLGYLLCRIADTIEDHTAVTADVRDELFRIFLEILERDREPKDLEDAFATIPGQDAELDLSRSMVRVMRVFRAQDERTRAASVRWVTEMARGMNIYAHRTPGDDGVTAIHTISDLERYCFYVAGTVGHLLTDLFVDAMNEDPEGPLALTLRDHAEGFATGLQLTNILKDVTDDLARQVSFIPRTECIRQGFSVGRLADPELRHSAHRAVAPLFDLAKARLDSALEYSLTIPKEEVQIRLFCLLPLWMAARTLVLARGNDAMFTPGQPVKISRPEVEALIKDCVSLADDDAALRDRYRELFEHNDDTSRGEPQGPTATTQVV